MLLARLGPCSLSLPDLPIIARQTLPQSTGQFWLEPCGSSGQAGVSSKHDLLAKHWNGEKLLIDSSLPISLCPALALSLCCPWGMQQGKGSPLRQQKPWLSSSSTPAALPAL